MKEHHQDTAAKQSGIEPPSLEQILQTIRGVIAEGEDNIASDSVLLLTEIVNDDGSVVNIRETLIEPPVQPSVPKPLFTQNTTSFSSRYFSDALAEEVNSPATTPVETIPSPSQTGLLSEESARASAQSLNDLLQAVSLTKAHPGSPQNLPFRSGQTLEDLVLELLKPQLSQWLDKNLPKLIQQLVVEEIHKLLPTQKGDHR